MAPGWRRRRGCGGGWVNLRREHLGRRLSRMQDMPETRADLVADKPDGAIHHHDIHSTRMQTARGRFITKSAMRTKGHSLICKSLHAVSSDDGCPTKNV